MANMDLVTNTGQAAIAYQDALNMARNTANALARQFGVTRRGPSGTYSVEAFQNAFDPNKLFSAETGKLDEAALGEALTGFGAGSTGMFADIGRSGATAEAESVAASRARGLGAGSGLAAQQRALAEAQTGAQMGQARSQFVSSIAQGLAPIGSAWQSLETAKAQDEAARQAALAEQATMDRPVDWSSINLPADAPVTPGPTAATGSTVQDIRQSPRGATLTGGPSGQFMMLFNENKNNRAALNSMKQRWSLTPQQIARIDTRIRQLG